MQQNRTLAWIALVFIAAAVAAGTVSSGASTAALTIARRKGEGGPMPNDRAANDAPERPTGPRSDLLGRDPEQYGGTWKDGEFLAPHSAAWDSDGNLYVMDWNRHGRITRLRRLPGS